MKNSNSFVWDLFNKQNHFLHKLGEIAYSGLGIFLVYIESILLGFPPMCTQRDRAYFV